jgi:stage II sporulation protein D
MRWPAGPVAALVLAGCAGSPRYTAAPSPEPPPAPPPVVPGPPRDESPIGGDVLVRVGVFWERGTVEIGSTEGLLVWEGDDRRSLREAVPSAEAVVLSVRDGDLVRARRSGGEGIVDRVGSLVLEPDPPGRVRVEGRELRGIVRVSARAGSLFVANELPLEDYLRGVVPKEIGRRPPEEREAVAAQAVAARTYTVRRLDQYNSLPFDVFGDVRDQVYAGVEGEDAVADAAVRETTGIVLADDGGGPIEAYYSSTCGGKRSDIRAVWPWRESHRALYGGPDGPAGAEWCRDSPHFRWTEEWSGDRLQELVHEHVPKLLELPPGSVRGRLRSVRITRRGPSGRAAAIEYGTTEGTWTVPGDRNRWVLRRPDGGILRSVQVELEVESSGAGIRRVIATGAGNGHGVGLCQYGAMGRARAGQTFRQILEAYYPGARVRPLTGADLPPGRAGAS